MDSICICRQWSQFYILCYWQCIISYLWYLQRHRRKHQRHTDFCNIIFPLIWCVTEGHIPSMDSSKTVFMRTRHGDRQPRHIMPQLLLLQRKREKQKTWKWCSDSPFGSLSFILDRHTAATIAQRRSLGQKEKWWKQTKSTFTMEKNEGLNLLLQYDSIIHFPAC